jgi:Phasin protein
LIMSKTRIGRPPGNTRSARRSLVELTAAASRAVDDGSFVMSASLIAASANDPPRSEHAAKTSSAIDATQSTAPSPVAVPESLNAAVSRSGELVDSDSTAEMVVKIAKDYQNSAFESIKVSLNAALDHAKDFAETRAGGEAAPKDHGDASLNDFLTVLEGAAAEFRAEALELMKANVITTLEYARDLGGTATAAEFVELSSAQARKQCELILKQAGALKSLAQSITKPSAD